MGGEEKLRAWRRGEGRGEEVWRGQSVWEEWKKGRWSVCGGEMWRRDEKKRMACRCMKKKKVEIEVVKKDKRRKIKEERRIRKENRKK